MAARRPGEGRGVEAKKQAKKQAKEERQRAKTERARTARREAEHPGQDDAISQLAKVLALLASDTPGEVLAPARKAEEARQRLGYPWLQPLTTHFTCTASKYSRSVYGSLSVGTSLY